MSHIMTESEVEDAALEFLSELGYDILHGPDISPGGDSPERETHGEVILLQRLRSAIDKLNPDIPDSAKEEAIRKIQKTESPLLVTENQRFHQMLVNGVPVEYRESGRIKGDQVKLFDFEEPNNNEFLAVKQFTVIENDNNRRPDIVIFVNGLPLSVIELKNPADENATLWSAFNQFDTYKDQIPSLFRTNEILIVSDGMEARAGTITSDKEWFMLWRTIDGSEIKSDIKSRTLEVLLKGMFNKTVFLDLVRHFLAFEKERGKTSKKLAGYHQYYAVNRALQATDKASSPKGDRRCGVVWHTQGSGKSLTMAFYTGKLVLELDNPTIVVITDQNDLDDQLYGTFSRNHELLRQKPVQATSRANLKELLQVASGGVIFTTIQKFFPEERGMQYPLLTERRNVIVIADEAHRSQYGLRANVVNSEKEAIITYGFAKHMRDALPNASFIGFTATPIEKSDRNTPAVFGNYIDIYDIEQAVNDGATVRIYYESRLAKLDLKEEEKPKIDPDFEELTEGEELRKKEKLKSKWARLEALVGSEKRIKQIAKDIVTHFEKRLEAMDGKGMIVGMSRRICVDLHKEIVKLKPEWYHKDDDKGIIKVIMTGSASDPKTWQEHIRTKRKRAKIRERMQDPDNSMKIGIVRDMWLCGFDAPSLHTMYVDKPMRGHGLMQAIARVNRVFKDKPGGLVVDYIGFAHDLKKALSEYTEGDKDNTGIPQEEAVAIMQEKYEIVTAILHGFNYKRFFDAKPAERMSIMAETMEHILQQEDGKDRFVQHVTELSKAFALSVPHEEAEKIRDEVGFFQAIKAQFVKTTTVKGKSTEELDSAVKQIVSRAIASEKVIDIFATAGLKKPDISILSDEFLAEVRGMQHKNLAFEALKKLLNDEIRARMRRNIVQGRSFAEMLENAVKRYQNRSVETAAVIEELIEIARKVRETSNRGDELNLSDEELAFYDALADNESAKTVLGDEKLRDLARELIDMVRKNVTIDWTLRENVQAKLRVMVKRILRKHGYPPDKQQQATALVLEQAKLICRDWAEVSV